MNINEEASGLYVALGSRSIVHLAVFSIQWSVTGLLFKASTCMEALQYGKSLPTGISCWTAVVLMTVIKQTHYTIKYTGMVKAYDIVG
jgi:hypothetical protein